MYNSTIQQQNLGTRNNDWRNSNELKRATSPMHSLDEGGGGTRQQQNKFGRRPLPTTTGGQSVAALQQQHKWLMQQQETTKPNNRSVSPIPTKSTSRNSNDNLMTMKQYTLPLNNSSNNDLDVVYDDNENQEDEEEGEDVEEERMVVIQDIRSKSPSINRGNLSISYFA